MVSILVTMNCLFSCMLFWFSGWVLHSLIKDFELRRISPLRFFSCFVVVFILGFWFVANLLNLVGVIK